jgi:hypothetical protein
MEISQVKSEGTLNDWLEFSQDQTQRNLGALSRRGVMPTASLQLCNVAELMRHRDLSDKLDALGYLWEANLNAAAIRYLLVRCARSRIEPALRWSHGMPTSSGKHPAKLRASSYNGCKTDGRLCCKKWWNDIAA